MQVQYSNNKPLWLMTPNEAFEKWWGTRLATLPWENDKMSAAEAFGAGWGAHETFSAGVAQLAEQAVCSGQVAGSTPAAGSSRGWWADVPQAEIPPTLIWAYWPVKKARGAAMKAIEKAMKKEDPAKLLEAVKAFAAAFREWPAEDRQYCPMCSTFMNQERWLDDRSTWQRGKPVQASQFSVHH